MITFFKRILFVIIFCVIMANLNGCMKDTIPKPTKQNNMTNNNELSSPFYLLVEENSEYHVLSLFAMEKPPVGLPQNRSMHQFTSVSERDNQITLSCNDIRPGKNTTFLLLLSLCDSDSNFLCTYTFDDVTLSENARIELSDIDNGTIKIIVDQVETTYTGYLSAIS